MLRQGPRPSNSRSPVGSVGKSDLQEQRAEIRPRVSGARGQGGDRAPGDPPADVRRHSRPRWPGLRRRGESPRPGHRVEPNRIADREDPISFARIPPEFRSWPRSRKPRRRSRRPRPRRPRATPSSSTASSSPPSSSTPSSPCTEASTQRRRSPTLCSTRSEPSSWETSSRSSSSRRGSSDSDSDRASRAPPPKIKKITHENYKSSKKNNAHVARPRVINHRKEQTTSLDECH